MKAEIWKAESRKPKSESRKPNHPRDTVDPPNGKPASQPNGTIGAGVASGFPARDTTDDGAVRVRRFVGEMAPVWRSYVDGHPEGTLFHGLGWKRAVERAFGHRSRYLVAFREDCDGGGGGVSWDHRRDAGATTVTTTVSTAGATALGGRVVGVFPLFEVNSVLVGRLLVSVPYATYGGILADDAAAATALFAEARREGLSSGARSIEMRSIRARVPGVPVHRSHAMFRKALPQTAADLSKALPRKARAAARRAAEKYELTVEYDAAALPVVWDLYSRSMRRLGSPNYPLRFFEELVSTAGDGNVVQLIRHRGRPVAGLLTFLHRDTVMPYFAGLDERVAIYGLNNTLYAESMRWGIEHGYRAYDFGRTRIDNAGGYNFKRFCGFEPEVLSFQTYVMPGRAAADLSAGSARWAAARRVWKTLPLPVTRPLGAWLSRSIPG